MRPKEWRHNQHLAFVTHLQDPGSASWLPAGVDALDITNGHVTRIVSSGGVETHPHGPSYWS